MPKIQWSKYSSRGYRDRGRFKLAIYWSLRWTRPRTRPHRFMKILSQITHPHQILKTPLFNSLKTLAPNKDWAQFWRSELKR